MQEKSSTQPERITDSKGNVPDVQTEAQTQLIAAKSETFEGPLPHPDILARYENILPGIADRIVRMAEAEQNARHSAIDQDAKNKSTLVDIAAKESAGALEAQKKGQNIGLAISLVCVLCAIVCALMDKPTIVTCAFLAVPTASLIGSFMPKLWNNDVKEDKR